MTTLRFGNAVRRSTPTSAGHDYRRSSHDTATPATLVAGISHRLPLRSCCYQVVIGLTTWDTLPSNAEIENIKPSLARIQELKNAAGNGLTGTQLMVFFLQRRIQPL
jgi:hypothetical protein